MEIDILHALHLGVYLQFVTDVIWALLRADAWSVGLRCTMEERVQLSVIRMKDDLFAWYQRVALERPDMHVQQLQDLTIDMLGSNSAPKFKLKAAESKSTLYFVVALLERFVGKLEHGAALLDAGRSLTRFQDILDSHGVHLPAVAKQDRTDDVCMWSDWHDLHPRLYKNTAGPAEFNFVSGLCGAKAYTLALCCVHSCSRQRERKNTDLPRLAEAPSTQPMYTILKSMDMQNMSVNFARPAFL